jgi:chromosome partitioning protein
MQGWIRKQTFSPENQKTLRRFSSWEVSELIFKVNQSTFRGRLAADPSLPGREVEEDGRQRWFSLEEINEMRRRMKINRRSLLPYRPPNKRAIRVAVANFKGGAGKSTVACTSPMPPRSTATASSASTSTRRRRSAIRWA